MAAANNPIIADRDDAPVQKIVSPPCPAPVADACAVVPERIGWPVDAIAWANNEDHDDPDSRLIAEQEAFLAADLESILAWDELEPPTEELRQLVWGRE